MTGRRDRKKQETREALTRSALKLVLERGIGGVTVEDISGEADVSSRTFFNYFSSKEEAVLGATPLVRARIADRVAAAPADLPIVETLRLVMRAEVAEVEEGHDLARQRMRICEENPSLLPYLVASGMELEQGLAAAIADRTGIKESDGYPVLVAAVVAATLRATMMRWSGTAGERPLADLLDEAFDLLAGGFAVPD
ncbi:acyl-CoA-like ligand-binding transcription factor [Streptosporangium soli]|nr:TetR family transcriptional regulator [Streptosporangium sp. KLBMP 9127]